LGDFLGACFFEKYRSSPYFRAYFFTRKNIVLISTKIDWATFWSIFYKLVWSPCTRPEGKKDLFFYMEYVSGAGLPDGTFSNQISKFGQIFEGLGMKKVGIFYGH
jgi:hypothetical protein